MLGVHGDDGFLAGRNTMTPTSDTIVTPAADIRLTQTEGGGLPVLMLHGSGASRRVFAAQLAGPVAARHRLIAPDLPGHGDSSDARDPASGYTLTGLARSVADVAKALELDRFAVFGWSLGGHIAIELLHHVPGICGLMLMGAPPVARGPLGMLRAFHANWDMLLASKEQYTPRDVERYARLCYGDSPPPDLVDDIRRTDGRLRPVFSRSMMRGDGADQKRTIERAAIPVAIVNGEHDPFIRHAYFAGLAIPTLWHDNVRIIENAGHAAFRDDAALFDSLLARFAADAENYPEPARVVARRA